MHLTLQQQLADPGDAQNFVGTIDLENNGNADNSTFTLNAKNADLNFDMSNDGPNSTNRCWRRGTTTSIHQAVVLLTQFNYTA